MQPRRQLRVVCWFLCITAARRGTDGGRSGIRGKGERQGQRGAAGDNGTGRRGGAGNRGIVGEEGEGAGEGALARGEGGLPDVVGDVVFGAEVEDVLFVYVVFAVGVEGVDADSFDGGEVVDFDAFAGEGVEAEVDGGFGAGGVGVFGGELGEAGDPGAEARFAVSADKVDLEAFLYFAELDGGGGVEDDAVGGEGLDELCVGQSRDRCGGGKGRVAREVTGAAVRPACGGRRRGGWAGRGRRAGVRSGIRGTGRGAVGRIWGLRGGGRGPCHGEHEGENAEGKEEDVVQGEGATRHETLFSSGYNCFASGASRDM